MHLICKIIINRIGNCLQIFRKCKIYSLIYSLVLSGESRPLSSIYLLIRDTCVIIPKWSTSGSINSFGVIIAGMPSSFMKFTPIN